MTEPKTAAETYTETAQPKTAAKNSHAPRRRRVRWADVLRAMPDSKTLRMFLGLMANSGITASSWNDGSKDRAPRVAMAEALTRTEDWLEGRNALRSQGPAVQEVRRRLECELWP